MMQSLYLFYENNIFHADIISNKPLLKEAVNLALLYKAIYLEKRINFDVNWKLSL